MSAAGLRSGRARLAFVASVPMRSLHLEWLARELDPHRFAVSFVLVCFRGRTPRLQDFLADRGVPFLRFDCGLGPVSLVRTVAGIYRHLRRERVEIVHTHMFLASVTGLLAGFLARVPVRIDTRHHHLHNRHPAVVRLDRLVRSLATRLVVLSRIAGRDLTERHGVPPEKVELIHLGIDLDAFRDLEPERVAAVRRRHGLEGGAPVVGVIGRWIESKGIQHVIPAFRRLLERYPGARLVLAHARGPYRREIACRLRDLPPESVVEIEFEDDVFALYRTFDVCVHVPVAEELETFGLIYVEALAAGVPGLFTLSGVAREILEHGRNCWLVDHGSSDGIYEGLVTLLGSADLRARLVREGLASVRPAFGLRTMIHATERLYARCLAEAGRGPAPPGRAPEPVGGETGRRPAGAKPTSPRAGPEAYSGGGRKVWTATGSPGRKGVGEPSTQASC